MQQITIFYAKSQSSWGVAQLCTWANGNSKMHREITIYVKDNCAIASVVLETWIA